MEFWNFGIWGFGDLGIWGFWDLGICWNCWNWKKIIKVVFALVRSGPKKDNKKKNKENDCLLTTAPLQGWPWEKYFNVYLTPLILCKPSATSGGYHHPLEAISYLGRLLNHLRLSAPPPAYWPTSTDLEVIGCLCRLLVISGEPISFLWRPSASYAISCILR